MRILVLGNNKAALTFFNIFKDDTSNIVFTTIKGEAAYCEFDSGDDIVEFCVANEIDFVLITEEKYILFGVEKKLNEESISVFAPSKKAVKTISFQSDAKRFMHKAKINTPKFFIAQKPQFAFEYIKENNYPFAIKPDRKNNLETTHFIEHYKDAKEVINNLFLSDNEKIVIEDYVEGRNIEVWALSTGYSAKIIGINAKFQNEIALLEPEFVDDNLKEEIQQTIINPTIDALCAQNSEYMGIIGFDIILTYSNEIYLVGFNTFFDEISAPLYTEECNWLDIMDSTLIGDVFLKYDFKSLDIHKIALKTKDGIETLEACSKSSLKWQLKELGVENKYLDEAFRGWSF